MTSKSLFKKQTTATYLITGTGLSLSFNGSAYAKPDQAAIEEGRKLSKSFRNVQVHKMTEQKDVVIFKAPTNKQLAQQRVAKLFVPVGRPQFAYS